MYFCCFLPTFYRQDSFQIPNSNRVAVALRVITQKLRCQVGLSCPSFRYGNSSKIVLGVAFNTVAAHNLRKELSAGEAGKGKQKIIRNSSDCEGVVHVRPPESKLR
ncbi:hypothetical protein NPIL_373971 [Nephila pilipes]|uniref:Uncharacterized protein n=1 Tax=Nephila pilipes TaxID=299642 RepID=A0A8X6NZX1_NEPPI|nr:hypothetical protein NPIL_373971 [Nephila pilipes]